MKTVEKLTLNLLLFVISASFVFPLVWIVYSSLKTTAEFSASVLALPKSFHIDSYKKIFEISNMPGYIVNSMAVSGISVFLILFFGYCIGYFLARVDFRLKTVVYAGLLAGMLIPIHSLMVPMYVIFSRFHLNDRPFTLVLPYVAFQLPIAVYLIESTIQGFPREMEEAAAIDGAGFLPTLFGIIFPMAKPSLTAAGIITFFFCWNEFSFALVLTTKEALRTIHLGLTLFSGSYPTDYPMLMSAMVIAVFPAMVIYFLFSKNIIKGMMAGAVKG